jgi:hypothetical protein
LYFFFKWDNWIWWFGHFFGRLECWRHAKNIGQPINSAKDDFAFTFNKEKNIGYISSNRSGIDHIYSVPICNSQIATVIKKFQNWSSVVNSRVVVLVKIRSF